MSLIILFSDMFLPILLLMKIIIVTTINGQYLSASNNTVFISHSPLGAYDFIFAQTLPPPPESSFLTQPLFSAL